MMADTSIPKIFTHGALALLSDVSTQDLLTYSFLSLCLIVSITRLYSSFNTQPKSIADNGAKTVPKVPYWMPLLGHIPSMAIDADGFVKGLRNRFNQGIFALNFGGTTHNIMYTPGLATALLNQKKENADAGHVSRGMLQSVFGFPSNEIDKFIRSDADIMDCYKHLLSEPSLGDMVEKTAKRIKENVLSLVTFTNSPVDQMLWERTSGIRVISEKDDEEVVEASLLPLIRDFCAQTAVPTLMGSNFLVNFPDFFEDIWTLDRGFLLLATGLPRWIPIPTLTRAHIARRKILTQVQIFHEAMEKEANGQDPGAEWRDLDDVGSLVKARMKMYREYGFSIRARAAIEHSLLWAANANSNALVFWMINRIYADSQLLDMIRKEIASYVTAVQPKKEFPIAEAPRLENFDVDGLCAHCPLLKSCYIESLRLDTASWSMKVVQQDFTLQSRGKEADSWFLRKGEYAHAAHDLHNTDPAYFENPLVWKADRHIKYDGTSQKGSADMGSIRPYGGGPSMCKGRAFAFKECMAFSAAIIALWDIEPRGGGEWKMPRHRKATGVYGTSDDTRVWLRRRKLPQES